MAGYVNPMRLPHAAAGQPQGKIRHSFNGAPYVFLVPAHEHPLKLQLVFVVTMITTIFNRPVWPPTNWSKMIEIARADQVPAAVLAQMMITAAPIF